MVALFAGYALTVVASSSAGRLGTVVRLVCGPDSARTLAGDTVARVDASGGSAYGCVAGGTRSFRLGRTDDSMRAARIEAVRVVGRIAAYGLRSSGVDTGYATVNVRRLTTGALLAPLSHKGTALDLRLRSLAA